MELHLPGDEPPIVAGFRRDGAASFYFGSDPVFQFNARAELRRAFVNNQLIKAARGGIVTMDRVRTESAVELHSRELTDLESTELLTLAASRLSRLLAVIHAGTGRIHGQVTSEVDVLARVRTWLERHATNIHVADSPRV